MSDESATSPEKSYWIKAIIPTRLYERVYILLLLIRWADISTCSRLGLSDGGYLVREAIDTKAKVKQSNNTMICVKGVKFSAVAFLDLRLSLRLKTFLLAVLVWGFCAIRKDRVSVLQRRRSSYLLSRLHIAALAPAWLSFRGERRKDNLKESWAPWVWNLGYVLLRRAWVL